MERLSWAFFLILLISVKSTASVAPESLSRYFTRVPIEQAHTISGEARDEAFDPSSIKVLVWNIKKTQEVSWKEEFLTYSKGRDLFLIQEAYPNDLFTSTISSFENVRWDMGISFRYKKFDNLPTGTMIGSKVLPSELVIKHTIDFEPVTDTPKAMTFGKYPLRNRNQELLVINVHGINFTDLDSFKRNIGQAEEAIEKHKGPILIAGDFNTRTKTRLSHLYVRMKKHGLKEIVFKNADQRMVASFTKNFLDFGFSRGLSVKDAEVLGSSKGSDHKPMILEISIND